MGCIQYTSKHIAPGIKQPPSHSNNTPTHQIPHTQRDFYMDYMPYLPNVTDKPHVVGFSRVVWPHAKEFKVMHSLQPLYFTALEPFTGRDHTLMTANDRIVPIPYQVGGVLWCVPIPHVLSLARFHTQHASHHNMRPTTTYVPPQHTSHYNTHPTTTPTLLQHPPYGTPTLQQHPPYYNRGMHTGTILHMLQCSTPPHHHPPPHPPHHQQHPYPHRLHKPYPHQQYNPQSSTWQAAVFAAAPT